MTLLSRLEVNKGGLEHKLLVQTINRLVGEDSVLEMSGELPDR